MANGDNKVAEQANDNESVAPENEDDKIQPTAANAKEQESDEDSIEETRTRSGRVSRPYDYTNKFPHTYGMANLMVKCKNDRCLRPYYQDEDLKYHLSAGIMHSSDFFTNGITVMELETPSFDEEMKRLEVGQH